MQAHHMDELDAPSRAHGGPREPHTACLVSGDESPSLSVLNREKELSTSLLSLGPLRAHHS